MKETVTCSSGEVNPEEYWTIEEVQAFFDVQRSQARALVGEPDNIRITSSGQIQYLFSRARVTCIKQRRDERIARRKQEAGKRSCYLCRKKYNKHELCGGICPTCAARKLVRNFACSGDYFKNPLDLSRLHLLQDAIDYFLATGK